VRKNKMHFSSKFALIFILAGISAGIYFIKNDKANKNIPIAGMAICALYTLLNYDFPYAMLTLIEYAIGYGLAFAFIEKKNIESLDEEKK